MQNQNKKIAWWVLGGGILMILLLIPETLIAYFISNNNSDDFKFYCTVMFLITLFTYIIISGIKFEKYKRYVDKYRCEKIEKAQKELSSEFKEVKLNYSEPIPKEFFKCQAKVESDEKIVCKIQLEYEVKFESYEKFLTYFHFFEH